MRQTDRNQRMPDREYSMDDEWSRVKDFTSHPILEKRHHQLRIYGVYPAIVRSREQGDRRVEEKGELVSLSPTDCYLLLNPSIALGTKLLVLVRLSSTPCKEVPHIALRGVVVRIDPQPADEVGVAVALTSYRFL